MIEKIVKTCYNKRKKNKNLTEGTIVKSKWQLFASIFQLIVGILAVVAYVILAFGGENMTRWIVTLVLAVGFVVLGIIGIIDYKSER